MDEPKVTIFTGSGERVGTLGDLKTLISEKFEQLERGGRLPVKETAADVGVRQEVYRVTAEELRAFIERIERLEAEKRELADQVKEVFSEAKGRGYHTKVMRQVIALRKREPNDVAEEEAVLEMYKQALGM